MKAIFCIHPALGMFLSIMFLVLPARADTTISTNTAQSGGTFTVNPPVLLVTDGSSNPILLLANGASASWTGSTVIGNLNGDSGNLQILSGSVLSNNGVGWIKNYGTTPVYSGRGYLGLNAGSIGTAIVSGAGSQWIMSSDNDQSLSVGHNGTGELSITNGGSVSSRLGDIGENLGSSGSVSINGLGSQLNVTSELHVGRSGQGELTIANKGLVSSYYGYIGSQGSGEGRVTVSGAGSQWNITGVTSGPGLFVGRVGHGQLSIQAGASVSSHGGMVGQVGGMGSVRVTGVGSQWMNSASLNVGSHGKGELMISNGGLVSSVGNSSIGVGLGGVGGEGKVAVTGTNSQWTLSNGSLIVGDDSIGELAIANGGKVSSGLDLWVSGLGRVNLEVSNNGMLQVGRTLYNYGLIRLTAAPGLSHGSYTPIEVEASWLGTGSYESIGGVWNSSTHEFVVAPAQNTSSGNEASVNLSSTQRIEITGLDQQVRVAFDSNAEAVGGGSTISFTATENGIGEISNREVLSAWDFETDLAFGTEIQLSLEVGAGLNSSRLTAWHSEDGIVWTIFQTDIFYDGLAANFFVTGFSSYAITTSAVPESSTTLLLLLAGVGMLMQRLKKAGKA